MENLLTKKMLLLGKNQLRIILGIFLLAGLLGQKDKAKEHKLVL